MAFNEANYSRYDLSIVFDESTSSVEGNLTVDFYNNDPVNFTEIPFHLYLFGMLNISRPGEIKILNVSKLGNPNAALLFNISIENHIMWVKLDKTLEAYQRSQFVISFNATIPDSWDRANSFGEFARTCSASPDIVSLSTRLGTVISAISLRCSTWLFQMASSQTNPGKSTRFCFVTTGISLP